MSDLVQLLSDPTVRPASEQRITWSYDRWVRALRQTERALMPLPALDRLEDRWALDDRGIS